MCAKIREPSAAGHFYPGEKNKLSELLDEILNELNKKKNYKTVRALIVPHASYTFSGLTAARAFSYVTLNSIQRVIIIGPSHHIGFHGISIAPYDLYRTPLGDVDVDQSACDDLFDSDPLFTRNEQAHRFEHSLEVELPFIQKIAPESKIIPLVTGDLSLPEARKVAEKLRAWWDTNTLVVISSDFTHYGKHFRFCPFSVDLASKGLEKLDQGAIQHILGKDTEGFVKYVQETGATICGRIPITIFLALLEATVLPMDAHLIDYTNSGKILKDYTNSVSYASILTDNDPSVDRLVSPLTLKTRDKQILLNLAHDAIASKFNNQEILFPGDAPAYLFEKGSVFVTLRIQGELRGCIGCINAEDSFIHSVIKNARSAAFEDPRFPPLSLEDLDQVAVEIACLGLPRSISTIEEINLGKHGIILEQKNHRAVFLPQVPIEHQWDKETTLENLSLKAGLSKTAWCQQGVTFSIFETVSFKDPDNS